MKKYICILLTLIVFVSAVASVCAYAAGTPEKNEAVPKGSQVFFDAAAVVSQTAQNIGKKATKEETEPSKPEISSPVSFSNVQEEIVYKMLNSVDYFSTAKVSFSALFPGFDVEQDFTIETNLDTGIAHQTCSDNFAQVRSAEKSKAYETYSDGKMVREYNNLERTVRNSHSVQERQTLAEEWPNLESRYYIDENGDPHYCYRSNPTNADMAGECLFPQVSAFAYLMDKDLWEVAENTTYLDRACYLIQGVVNESYSAQIGASTFIMYVDRDTGILLKLEAKDDIGTVVSSMSVSEITIDAPAARNLPAYDMSKYEGYTELID